jgi:ribosomal protein L6P/L9E
MGGENFSEPCKEEWDKELKVLYGHYRINTNRNEPNFVIFLCGQRWVLGYAHTRISGTGGK